MERDSGEWRKGEYDPVRKRYTAASAQRRIMFKQHNEEWQKGERIPWQKWNNSSAWRTNTERPGSRAPAPSAEDGREQGCTRTDCVRTAGVVKAAGFATVITLSAQALDARSSKDVNPYRNKCTKSTTANIR